jgi:hypothetical protein
MADRSIDLHERRSDLHGSYGEIVVKRRGVLLAVAAAAAGALAGPSPTLAAAAPDLVANPAAADRDFVRWLSVRDPRAEVGSAALAALNGGTVTAFLTSGYASAADQAAQARARHLDYASRTVTAHPAQIYPWVNAAARRAVNGTDAELAAFSSTGYAVTLAKDNAAVPYDDGAAQVDQEARDFVEDLAYLDPSTTVRERARNVITDADVAEFLRYGWLSAARIDVDAFRAQYVADEWVRWREARQATATAVAVEQAARAGTADPVAAIHGWDTVRTRFARQPAGWAERERFARTRVDGWTRNVLTLGWSTSPLLGALVSEGSAVRSQWTSELTHAAEQADWWNQLVQYAQAAANAWIYPDA